MKNQYALIRQADNIDDITITETDPPVGDLFAIYFPELWNMKNACFEIIEPEWIDGKAITASAGTVTDIDGYSYSITDVSDFDYVLIPCVKKSGVSNSVACGMCSGAGTAIVNRITIGSASGYHDEEYISYMLAHVLEDNYYAAITSKTGVYVPIIGIRIAEE